MFPGKYELLLSSNIPESAYSLQGMILEKSSDVSRNVAVESRSIKASRSDRRPRKKGGKHVTEIEAVECGRSARR